jgi:glycosyltransferase involved in cell wall biosynthesis
MVNSRALVSICIPTFNGERYLDECLASACSQTYPHLEVLVVDDCSSDSTVDMVRGWAGQDDRIRLEVNASNMGLVGNFNRCVALARGDWVKFLFQDDRIDPRCVEVLLAHAGGEWKFLACDREIIYDNVSAEDEQLWRTGDFNIHLGTVRPGRLELSPRDIAGLALDYGFRNFVGEPTATLVHRSVFQAVGNFNSDLVHHCDIEFWLRAGMTTGIRYVDEMMAAFRVHHGSASAANWRQRLLRTGRLDPLIILHQCLYSPFFMPWRQEAADRGVLASKKVQLRMQSLRDHTRLVLDRLEAANAASAAEGSGTGGSANGSADWDLLVARYPGLGPWPDRFVPAVAEMVHWKRSRGQRVTL